MTYRDDCSHDNSLLHYINLTPGSFAITVQNWLPNAVTNLEKHHRVRICCCNISCTVLLLSIQSTRSCAFYSILRRHPLVHSVIDICAHLAQQFEAHSFHWSLWKWRESCYVTAEHDPSWNIIEAYSGVSRPQPEVKPLTSDEQRIMMFLMRQQCFSWRKSVWLRGEMRDFRAWRHILSTFCRSCIENIEAYPLPWKHSRHWLLANWQHLLQMLFHSLHVHSL